MQALFLVPAVQTLLLQYPVRKMLANRAGLHCLPPP